MRPLIDYGDILYDQPKNELFCVKVESFQDKAALIITSAIQSFSRENLYQEFGLESFKFRRWYKRLCCMFKIMNNAAPNYLINFMPKRQRNVSTRKELF